MSNWILLSLFSIPNDSLSFSPRAGRSSSGAMTSISSGGYRLFSGRTAAAVMPFSRVQRNLHAQECCPFGEALDLYCRPFCRERLIERHIQGAWEGDEAQIASKLAALVLPGEEILGLFEARQDFSAHDFRPARSQMHQASSIRLTFRDHAAFQCILL
jgi:hypothetical protein